MSEYRETLRQISNKNHEMHNLVHNAMDSHDPGSPEWAELYIMARLVSALGDMAYHIGALGGQASARTEPVADDTAEALRALRTQLAGK